MNFTTQIFLLMAILSSLHVSCFEFQVGERPGWVVPPANDTKLYNDWASKERFIVGDTIRFKYRKDSVMEVTKSDYKNCNSTRPNFFSNTGNTIFTLDRSGFFYFISGATGHCRKGQQMIIRVMTQDQDSSAGGGSSSSSAGCRNIAVISYGVLFLIISIQFVA
ncbi:early nodulin-like protein 21 [Abeliophyllum distichum]|uniref:Early nodulin-like protein 21 n=1 Tax=Abeliophyllum distichum TaxID=126358 RepID=A0ABD1SHL2_9LAMI